MGMSEGQFDAQHWTYRFVENGVPLQDFRDTAGRVSTWSRWCREWEATGDLRCAEAEAAESRGAATTAAELRFVAALEYHFAKFLFVQDMTALRLVHAKAVSAYRRALPLLPWPGTQVGVDYGGTVLPGVLRLPDGTDQRWPLVVVVPGLDAAKEEMHRFSDAFLRRGMATYTFDGPGQGESEYDLRLVGDWERVAGPVVERLRGIDRVDADRIAVVGVSLGGYFAARAASFDLGLRAGVSVGGCHDLDGTWSGLPALSREAFRVRTGAGDGDEACKRAAEFSLADVPATGSAPFLVVHGERDALFDTGQARRMHAHFGDRCELLLEPNGNHVLHNLAYRVRPVIADWVKRQLGR